MAYTSTNSNFTTSAGIAPSLQTYYNRTLLQSFEPELVHLQFGETYPMPKNNGMVMNMRKLIPLEAKTTELAEGNPGEGVLLSETQVTVPLKQYGDYSNFSDLFDMANIDCNLTRKVELFANAGARSVDAVAREELATCTNVIYANGKTSRSGLESTDKLTSRELRKAVRMLKKANAQRFGGYYIAIVGPETVYDLQDDESFVRVSQYSDSENIYTGEVGRLFGVRLVETSEANGVTSWKGAKPRVIIKPSGSAGTADPLDQISSVGWKMDGFGVKLLQPEYAVRIECGFTA